MDDKRLIEVDFPLKEVSKESTREKNIRHGHISTLHTWWARRPLAASRATIFAALVPAPRNREERRKKLEFITEFSKWENSLNKRLMGNARKQIEDFFGGKKPRVLDCFAGGGAIPLEALRLGCETYASELNPVAVLILKAVLEFPQKFGKGENECICVEGGLGPANNRLLEDVKKWGNWVLKEVRKEISKFYPSDPDGSISVGYIWAKTIKCQNPSCNIEIPLMRQLWLARKENKKIAIKIVLDKKNNKLTFRIAKDKEIDFEPSVGTTRKATVLCPMCGSGMDGKTVRKKAREGRMGQRLVAVVLYKPNQKGKRYRIANENDAKVFNEAAKYLEEKVKNWKWDFNPVPDEDLPTPNRKRYSENGLFYNFVPVVLYGLRTWGDLFNSRQKLALITFMEKIKQVHEKMLTEDAEKAYTNAVVSYLAFTLDRMAMSYNTLTQWQSGYEKMGNMFSRQAVSMVWDYAEPNASGASVRSWVSLFSDTIKVISHCSQSAPSHAAVIQASSISLPYPDNYFDAVITDPPYYDNIPYSDLSDFFYVWLKRTIGDLYPDLFSTPLTPKSQEIIDDLSLLRGIAKDKAKQISGLGIKDKKFFEEMMGKSFKEIYRVLKPEGIACIVFAHKSTEAWEAIINALLNSGLYLTASWPLHTERKTRMRGQASAALASSIYMVCRKRTDTKSAYFNEINTKIDQRIRERLNQFWQQGISGADFFTSAIGPAVEVFGKYSRVEKLSGDAVSVQELLEYVRKIVSEFALERVLKDADLGGVDSETRFYLLWRWTFANAKVHFDDAIKLSRPMGVELTDLWEKAGFVKKEKEFIRVLGPKERAKEKDFAKGGRFTSMIDVLHYVVILWEKSDRQKIKEILEETGYGGNEIFWQTAQALSELLPEGDKEKQLLQGFLYGKEVYIKEAARGKKTLLDFVEG